MTTTPKSPLPDWEKQHLFIVDPGLWPENVEPHYDVRPVFAELRAAFRSLGIKDQVLTRADSPLDIWIRDWGFVEGCYFQYDPPYANPRYKPKDVTAARTGLDHRTGIKPRSHPLNLDGGNLVHNGSVAIVADKVQADTAELERAIISLGFERVVFIPVELEDTVGHADGIVRFVSRNVLLVNHCDDPNCADYERKLDACLRAALPGCELVPFPGYFENKSYKGIPSAVGCYINFILTAHGAVLPVFDNKLDDEALAVLRRCLALPIQTVSATALAKHGGVFNCATLTF